MGAIADISNDNITDNTTNAITPAKVREVFNEVDTEITRVEDLANQTKAYKADFTMAAEDTTETVDLQSVFDAGEGFIVQLWEQSLGNYKLKTLGFETGAADIIQVAENDRIFTFVNLEGGKTYKAIFLQAT